MIKVFDDQMIKWQIISGKNFPLSMGLDFLEISDQ